MKKLGLIAVVIMSVILVSGCGGIKTKDGGKISFSDDGIQIENSKGEKASMSSEDGKLEIKSDEGSYSLASDDKGVSLPKDYPNDLIPVPKNVKIEMAMKNASDGKTSFMVMYYCGGTVDDKLKLYKDAMKDATDTQEFDLNGSMSISGKLKGSEIAVTIAPQESEDKDKKVMVTISIATQAQK